jgi:hypothetical protein
MVVAAMMEFQCGETVASTIPHQRPSFDAEFADARRKSLDRRSAPTSLLLMLLVLLSCIVLSAMMLPFNKLCPVLAAMGAHALGQFMEAAGANDSPLSATKKQLPGRPNLE